MIEQRNGSPDASGAESPFGPEADNHLREGFLLEGEQVAEEHAEANPDIFDDPDEAKELFPTAIDGVDTTMEDTTPEHLEVMGYTQDEIWGDAEKHE